MSNLTENTTTAESNTQSLPVGIHREHYSENLAMYTVESTPFSIIMQDGLHYVTLGKFRLSAPMNTIEEAAKDAERMDWNRIVQVIGAVTQITKADEEIKEMLTVK